MLRFLILHIFCASVLLCTGEARVIFLGSLSLSLSSGVGSLVFRWDIVAGVSLARAYRAYRGVQTSFQMENGYELLLHDLCLSRTCLYEENYEIPIIDFPTILLFGQTY